MECDAGGEDHGGRWLSKGGEVDEERRVETVMILCWRVRILCWRSNCFELWTDERLIGYLAKRQFDSRNMFV